MHSLCWRLIGACNNVLRLRQAVSTSLLPTVEQEEAASLAALQAWAGAYQAGQRPDENTAVPPCRWAKGPRGDGELRAPLLAQILGQSSRESASHVSGRQYHLCLAEQARHRTSHLAHGSPLQAQAGQGCSWLPSTLSAVMSFSANNSVARSKVLEFSRTRQIWSSSEDLS